MVTTRNAAKRKRSSSPAGGDYQQETRRPSRSAHYRRVVDQDKDDDNPVVVEMRPSHTSVAMVETLLDKCKAERVMDCIIALGVSENEEIRNEFKGTDICANLVRVLNAKKKARGMKVKVCELLIALTYKDGFEKKLVAADAPKAIVKAMKRFPEQKLLQQRGCSALSNLAATTDKNVVKTLVEAGCIEVVVAAMRNLPAVAHLQSRAIFCLDRIIDTLPTTSAKMVANLNLVIAAMKKHTEIFGIQKYGCKFLIKLSASNEQAKQDIITQGGGVAAAAAERKYKEGNEDIHKMALQLVKCLYS